MTGVAGGKTEALARDLGAGNRRALAKAITLLESRRPADREQAANLLQALLPKSGGAVRLGVSGSPGVGKSTFIEAFGKRLLAAGHRLAVLAIDPSSPLSGGSILGDRVRMEALSSDPRVFIRPSPAGTTLGGAARNTREAIIACEAAGYDRVIVETVGVGQSETLAAGMVDVFLMLQLPNAGDEIQGIKRGILELADVVAVTKADGDGLKGARRTQGQLEQALMLARGSGRPLPPVFLISGIEGTGLAELEAGVEGFVAAGKGSGDFSARRKRQAAEWFRSEIIDQLKDVLSERNDLAALTRTLEGEVRDGKAAAVAAAQAVVRRLLKGP
jgi:LAO/AO transport system kinase